MNKLFTIIGLMLMMGSSSATASDLINKPIANKVCVGVVELRVQDSSFSLDIGRHIKNSMNSFTFISPMFIKDYDNASIGDRLSDSFKTGSAIFGGSLTWTKIKITRKLGYMCEE